MCWPCGRQLPVADRLFPWSSSFVRQMACTPEEFIQSVTKAFGNAATRETDGLLLSTEGVSILFALHPEKMRQIGALQLASLRVEIRVREGDADRVQQVLDRVDRATLRGGG